MAGLKLMSRKTMLTVLAVMGAIFGFVNAQFSLGVDTVGLMATISAILLWVGFEARLDMKRILGLIKEQSNKFTDPKFWIALVTAFIMFVNEMFDLSLPVEAIVAVLAIIMGFLFKKESDAVV